MKKYIIFLIILLSVFTSKVEAQIRLSSPIEKAVYQRDDSGNATIYFAGQVPQIPCGEGNFLKYNITKISLQDGSPIYTVTSFTTISNDVRGRFFFTNTFSTGWYSVTFQTYFNNSLTFTNSYKFGVGDVYVIAGQSNAQSISLSDASDQTPSSLESGDVTYEAVVSCNYQEYCSMPNGKMPKYPVFSTLASGTGIGSLGNAIAPTGFNNWCYTRLGNQLAAQGVPVAFFNAAAGGSSIRNWYESRNGGNTTNIYGGYTFCSNASPGISGEPYATFQKTLNYYGSLFGVRAILWHQGETDNKNVTSGSKPNPDVTQAEYKADLETIIQKSWADFGSNVPWVVSKTSFNLNTVSSDIIDAQTQVINNLVFSVPASTGAVTDQYGLSYRRNSDQVHFNNNIYTTGIDGLRTLGNEWKTKLPISNSTPILPSPLQDITIVKNSSNFTMTAPTGTGYSYFWVAGNDRLDNSVSTSQTISPTDAYDYKCFVRKPDGNYFLTTSCFGKFICSNGNNRESAEINNFSGVEDNVSLKSYPNPSSDDFTIEFDVPFEAESVKMELTNLSGTLLKTIAKGSFAKGHYSYPMVGKELISGTYVCRLVINEASYSTKIVKLGK